jgi:hypothetical protein
MISQTVQFTGCNARRLYDAYLSSADHAAMTVAGPQAATFRRGAGNVGTGGEGDELRAFGMPEPEILARPGGRWPVAASSQPGLFAAGDIRHGPAKRVASAVGEGAMAVALIHDHLAQLPSAQSQRSSPTRRTIA